MVIWFYGSIYYKNYNFCFFKKFSYVGKCNNNVVSFKLQVWEKKINSLDYIWFLEGTKKIDKKLKKIKFFVFNFTMKNTRKS